MEYYGSFGNSDGSRMRFNRNSREFQWIQRIFSGILVSFFIESVRLFSAEKSRGFQVHLAGFLPLSISVVLDLLLVKPAGFGAKPLMIAVVYHQVLPLFSVVPSFYGGSISSIPNFSGSITKD